MPNENIEDESGFFKLWVRKEKGETTNQIIRRLSPSPFSPFPIKIQDKLEESTEEEGSIVFTISDFGNLFDFDKNHIIIFDVPIKSSRLILIREQENFCYYHINPNFGVRRAKIDSRKYSESKGLQFFVTWSSEGNRLAIGDAEKKVGLTQKTGKEIPVKTKVGEDGSIYAIGGEGLDVRMVYMEKRGKPVLEPSAIEIFEFNLERVKSLLEGIEAEDFLFQTTLAQTGLVVLVTAFETYCKERFKELEIEGWDLNFDQLCDQLYSNRKRDSRKEEIREKAKESEMNISRVLAEDWQIGINFQNFDQCKMSFNKGYGIKFGEINGVSSQLIERVRSYINSRHEIIHSSSEQTILNREELPEEDPEFATKEFLEKAKDDFEDFIKNLDSETKKAS